MTNKVCYMKYLGKTIYIRRRKKFKDNISIYNFSDISGGLLIWDKLRWHSQGTDEVANFAPSPPLKNKPRILWPSFGFGRQHSRKCASLTHLLDDPKSCLLRAGHKSIEGFLSAVNQVLLLGLCDPSYPRVLKISNKANNDAK